MRLSVTHRTTYSYGDAVTTSHHEARLAPREGESQRTVAHELSITPTPEARRRRFDYFGNRTVHFSLSEPHRSMSVIARSIVELKPVAPPDLHATPPWENVAERLRNDRRRDVLDAYAMTFDSPYVAASLPLLEFSDPFFERGRPLLEAVQDLVAFIYEDFTYDPRATDLSTPILQVLRERRGVCQDFAHLAIGCLRARGLAARYISGYLLTKPPPGKVKMVGADASHAWFATFVPEHGWVDFDPTNNVMPQGEHVTIAHGRDFSDVTPIRGVILGGGHHQLSVAVDVDALDDNSERERPLREVRDRE
jgi:transglutaminase-like putative cysteine protease